MVLQAGSRLAIVTVLLVLQVLIFVLELLIFITSIKEYTWYTPLRQWFGPVGITLLVVILVPVTFTSQNVEIESMGKQCSTSVDADLAGDGVRIAVWVQVAVLLIITMLGSFHSKATGTKEIGAGVVITYVSLAIALLVQASRRTMSLADAATGAMILDAQNIALSIQLVAKETLAARWQVRVVITAQAFGLTVLRVLVSKLGNGSFATVDCRYLAVFWWASLGNCPPHSREQAVFWIYFVCRCVGFCQTSFHSLYNMQSFDLAEHDGKPLRRITYPYVNDRGPASYREYPATVSLMYTLYGLFALTSLVAVETTIRDLNLSPTSAVDSIGQIIALVIAGATIVRATWLFAKLILREKKSKMLGFMWPFELGFTCPFRLQRLNFYYPTYLITPNLDIDPKSLPLGSILQDPSGLTTKFENGIQVVESKNEIPITNLPPTIFPRNVEGDCLIK